MAGPNFIDIRAQKYFASVEELENFKKFMQTFNMMNEDGEFTFSINLPSYVDDVVDVYIEKVGEEEIFYLVQQGEKTLDVVEGEADKLYIDIDSNSLYRWNGSNFVVVDNRRYSTDEQTQEMLDTIFGKKEEKDNTD